MAASSEIAAGRCQIHGLALRAAGTLEVMGRVLPQFEECPKCTTDKLARQAREQHEREENRLTNCGLLGRFRSTTFGNYEATTDGQRQALQACREFAATATPGRWQTLLLLGPVGVGKTHLLAATINAASAQRGMNAVLTSASQIIAAVRGTWRRDAERSEEQVIESLASTRVLAIDEIGAGGNSAADQKHLFDVIDRRYALGYPLAIASNCTAPELRAALGERAFDRLRESSRVVSMDWASNRGRA